MSTSKQFIPGYMYLCLGKMNLLTLAFALNAPRFGPFAFGCVVVFTFLANVAVAV